MISAFVVLVVVALQNPQPTSDTSPHTEHFSELNGVRLQYLDWGGTGEPMVMVTGYGSTAHTFDDLARRFTDRFRVVSFTRRGTAPSERTASGYDLATLTADLKALADALAFQKVHLVGHSFAGTEMTQFATLHPERVASVVYIDAALDFADGAAVLQDAKVSTPQAQPGSPYAQVIAWQNSYVPDFTKLMAPALAFYTTQLPFPNPQNVTDELRRAWANFAQNKWVPLINRMADKFRRETGSRAIIFDDSVSHYIFRDREDEVVEEMYRLYDSLK